LKNGHLKIGNGDPDTRRVSVWLAKKRRERKRKMIHPKIEFELTKLGVSWNPSRGRRKSRDL
jgi:hypothetical protein